MADRTRDTGLWPKNMQSNEDGEWEAVALRRAENGCDYGCCGSTPCTHRYRWWALCEKHGEPEHHGSSTGLHELPADRKRVPVAASKQEGDADG